MASRARFCRSSRAVTGVSISDQRMSDGEPQPAQFAPDNFTPFRTNFRPPAEGCCHRPQLAPYPRSRADHRLRLAERLAVGHGGPSRPVARSRLGSVLVLLRLRWGPQFGPYICTPPLAEEG